MLLAQKTSGALPPARAVLSLVSYSSFGAWSHSTVMSGWPPGTLESQVDVLLFQRAAPAHHADLGRLGAGAPDAARPGARDEGRSGQTGSHLGGAAQELAPGDGRRNHETRTSPRHGCLLAVTVEGTCREPGWPVVRGVGVPASPPLLERHAAAMRLAPRIGGRGSGIRPRGVATTSRARVTRRLG